VPIWKSLLWTARQLLWTSFLQVPFNTLIQFSAGPVSTYMHDVHSSWMCVFLNTLGRIKLTSCDYKFLTCIAVGCAKQRVAKVLCHVCLSVQSSWKFAELIFMEFAIEEVYKTLSILSNWAYNWRIIMEATQEDLCVFVKPFEYVFMRRKLFQKWFHNVMNKRDEWAKIVTLYVPVWNYLISTYFL
jgi:hypothetical protein